MPPIPPPHLSQKVVKKSKIAAKEKSLGEAPSLHETIR